MPRLYDLRRWACRHISRLADPFLLPIKKHRRTQFETLSPFPGAVVFLRDSFTEQWLWDEWFPVSQVSNRGIGAEVIEGVRAPLDTAPDRPRAVFVLIGTNDLGVGDRAESVVSRVSRLFKSIVERSHRTGIWAKCRAPASGVHRIVDNDLNRDP